MESSRITRNVVMGTLKKITMNMMVNGKEMINTEKSFTRRKIQVEL